jgi:hypothetical protein
MSSHHFVKEQQEPAVFILEEEDISFEIIAPLLEWSPTLLVAQEAVEVVLSWGIKIDVVLGTLAFQSEHRHLLEEQYPLRFLTVSSSTALEEGIQYLLASQHPVKGGKFSKWFAAAKIRLLAAENQPVEVSNAEGSLLFPVCYLTQLEVPEGISTFSSTDIFWIGEQVRG